MNYSCVHGTLKKLVVGFQLTQWNPKAKIPKCPTTFFKLILRQAKPAMGRSLAFELSYPPISPQPGQYDEDIQSNYTGRPESF